MCIRRWAGAAALSPHLCHHHHIVVGLQGVKNVADVSKEVGGVERVVLVSSCLVRQQGLRWRKPRCLENPVPSGLGRGRARGKVLAFMLGAAQGSSHVCLDSSALHAAGMNAVCQQFMLCMS